MNMESESKINAAAGLKDPEVGQDSEAVKSNHQSTNGIQWELSHDTLINMCDYVVLSEATMSSDSESDMDLVNGAKATPKHDESHPTESKEGVDGSPSDMNSVTSKHIRHPDRQRTEEELIRMSLKLTGKKSRHSFFYSVCCKGKDPQEKIENLLFMESTRPRKQLRKMSKLYLPKIKRKQFYLEAMRGKKPLGLMRKHLFKPGNQQWLLCRRLQLTDNKLLAKLFEQPRCGSDESESPISRPLREWFNIFLRESPPDEEPSLSGRLSTIKITSVEQAIDKVKKLVLQGEMVEENFCPEANHSNTASDWKKEITRAESSNEDLQKEPTYLRSFCRKAKSKRNKMFKMLNEAQLKVYNSWREKGLAHFDALTTVLKFPRGWAEKTIHKNVSSVGQSSNHQKTGILNAPVPNLSTSSGPVCAETQPSMQSGNIGQPPLLPGKMLPMPNRSTNSGPISTQAQFAVQDSGNAAQPSLLRGKMESKSKLITNSGPNGSQTQLPLLASENAAHPTLPGKMVPVPNLSTCSGPIGIQTQPTLQAWGSTAQPAFLPGKVGQMPNIITCSGPIGTQAQPSLQTSGNVAQPPFLPGMVAPVPNLSAFSGPIGVQTQAGIQAWGNVAQPPFLPGSQPAEFGRQVFGRPLPSSLQNVCITPQGIPFAVVGGLPMNQHPHVPIDGTNNIGVLNSPFILHQPIEHVHRVILPLAVAEPSTCPAGGNVFNGRRMPQKSKFVEEPITDPPMHGGTQVEPPNEPPSSADTLHLYIVPPQYPNEQLSDEQRISIESSIRIAISGIDDDRMKPIFKSTFRDGRYEVICKDQLAKKWFHKYVSSMYSVVALKIIPAEPAKIKMTATLPLCKNDDNDKIMKYIARQNTGLNVGQWEVVQRSDNGENTSLRLLVDQESAKHLKEFGEIHFKMVSGKIAVVGNPVEQPTNSKGGADKSSTTHISDASGSSYCRGRFSGNDYTTSSTSLVGLQKEQAQLPQAERGFQIREPSNFHSECKGFADLSQHDKSIPRSQQPYTNRYGYERHSQEGTEKYVHTGREKYDPSGSSKLPLERLKPMFGIERRSSLENRCCSYDEPPEIPRRGSHIFNEMSGQISRCIKPSQCVPCASNNLFLEKSESTGTYHLSRSSKLDHRERPGPKLVGLHRHHSQEYSRSQHVEPYDVLTNVTEPRILRKSYGDFLQPPQRVPFPPDDLFKESRGLENSAGRKKSPSPDFDELLRSARSHLKLSDEPSVISAQPKQVRKPTAHDEAPSIERRLNSSSDQSSSPHQRPTSSGRNETGLTPIASRSSRFEHRKHPRSSPSPPSKKSPSKNSASSLKFSLL